jgi:hypothetical protein
MVAFGLVLASVPAADRTALVGRGLATLSEFGWPIATVLMSFALLLGIRCIIDGFRDMVATRAKAQLDIEALLVHGRGYQSTSGEGWSSLNEVMLKLATAYDQYETPMNATLLNQLRRSIEQKWVDGGSDLLKGKSILWLHSNPHHDVYEANSFELCKAIVHFVFSADDAVKALSESSISGRIYDLVISHMGDRNDAFELKKRLDQLKIQIPMVVYTRRAQDIEFRRVAAENGLQRSTNLPHELFNIVLDELGSGVP